MKHTNIIKLKALKLFVQNCMAVGEKRHNSLLRLPGNRSTKVENG
jgi:hypothetical protein